MTHSLVTKAVKALPKTTPALQKQLLKEFAGQIPKEDITLFDEALLMTMSNSHWALAKKRKYTEAKMKIYCPVSDTVSGRKTIVDIVSDDFAFLLDSVVAEINKQDLLIDLLLSHTVYATYDKKNVLSAIRVDEKKGALRQAHIHIHIKEVLSSEAIQALETGLNAVLEDVYYANRDWKSMLAKLKETKEMLESARTKRPAKDIEKYCAFLDYLYDNNFTLLGYREYEFIEKKKELKSRTVRNSSLGLLHGEVKPAYISDVQEGLPRNLQELRRNLNPVSISKTNRLSTVHRRVPMDAIAVKVYNDKGEAVGERLFLGLFTSVTYSRSVNDVPYLREKVDEVVQSSGFRSGSHERKALRHTLEKYPRDELFQISVKDLSKITKNILRLSERQRIALFMRPDPFGRYVSCLVYIPRDRFGTKLRKEIGIILEQELGGEISDFYVNMDDSVFARVMFTINVSQSKAPSYNAEKIEDKLQEAGKTWQEALAEALAGAIDDEERVVKLTYQYADAFPVSYTSKCQARQAVFDIHKIQSVLEQGQIELDLYRPEGLDQDTFRLKVYNPGAPITLSDVLPILENFGLRVISELPFEVVPKGADHHIWIHDFLLERPSRFGSVSIKEIKDNFEKAFTKIWYRTMENDGLNGLVLTAALNWHETTILRAYVRYLKQIRIPFSRAYIEAALYKNPRIARLIVDLFKAYHNPKMQDQSAERVKACAQSINLEMKGVDSLDEDRILRAFVNLVEATLRTNYFQRQKDGPEEGHAKPYLSMKLDCHVVKDMPAPRPYRETFVYSPRVEAVHLRGDKIARGGLRWSDRREDFRTEVLGLMKAQMVKNSVIVPMGAKGGFVVKTKGLSREDFMAEGIECYKILIRGLLDICDNRKGTRVIPPKNVVRRDESDPYLVVAADKGTATFSDIANGLSQDYGFWLDDAFASGGSAGYDHKKMGITAKGGWESVKAHFRQLNHNTQTQGFDVVGVGDMGGDVFGNGMLLSNEIRLIGAFNHLHIFCDPDPDAASSFKERKRLFDQVKGWGDYNEKLLSKGGKIYSRADKTIKLTAEIKARFDLDKDQVSPNELLKAMLKSRTDLLWFGGIGTYIKSHKESNQDVGDKANDPIRINAEELRTKVIGEGANLGVTQLGRIEVAERGCKINTDFLDNSGGVDSSDHEVNIKILLTEVMAQDKHKMDIKKRNKLLEKMTDEVADHVLRNNYQQAQAVSLAELQARETLQIQNEFIQDLQRDIGLDRQIEGLPDEETVELRLRLGKGMTRPELCVLLSYAKIVFTNDLLNSDIPDSPDMQNWLFSYFPEILQKSFAAEIKSHRLAREIVATTMANSLVNRMGPTFIKSRMNKTSASTADIAKAYIIVREAFGLREIWDQIEGLDNKVPAEVQMKAMREVARLAEHAITWFLTRLGRDLDIGSDIEMFSAGVGELVKDIDKLVTSDLKNSINQRVQGGVRDGLPKALAHKIALMPVISSACDMIRISVEQKMNLQDTARTYFELGEYFHLDWLRSQARYLSADNHWESEAITGLVDHLFGCQAGLTMRILNDTKGRKGKADTLAERWFNDHERKLRQLHPLFDELRRVGTIDLAMLITAEQRLRQLYGG